ncbi:MAG: 2-dehydropantoate 2-reductase [Chloroflexi bacterium]|nr:2-dehydropantoate 2-reductase [Chloroflexota bacterium]
MRIGLLGTGALGCTFAARLAPVAEVWMLGAWSEGVAAVQRRGVTVHEPDGRLRQAQVRATNDPRDLPVCDVAVVLVKSYQTERAAAWAGHILAAGGLAVTLQNGLDNGPRLEAGLAENPPGWMSLSNASPARSLPVPDAMPVRRLPVGRPVEKCPGLEASAGYMVGESDRLILTGGFAQPRDRDGGRFSEQSPTRIPARAVAVGVTYNGATLRGPGEARHVALLPTYIAAPAPAADRAAAFVALLQEAGLPAHVDADIAGRLWGKATANAAINPLTALWRVPNGELLVNTDRRALLHALAHEAAAVATARGVTLPFEDPRAYVEEVCRATAANRSSMLQDIERGRPTEIDSINGVIVATGRRLNIPTPVNTTVWRLIRGLRGEAEAEVAAKVEVEAEA